VEYRDRLTVIQAYRFALDPTPRQVRDLLRHAGAARLAYNWGLARVKANLSQRAAERSYGIGEADLTPPVGWSLYAMRKDWNQAKAQVAPWWAECSKEAYNTGLDQLARALKNWSDSRNGVRKGRRVGFPRFKSRRKSAPSVRFTTGTIRVADDGRHVRLPRLGRLKTHESTRKLHRRVADGRARILAAAVRAEAGRWFVSFTVEVERAKQTPARLDAVIGVDLGVSTLAVFSDGRPAAANPKHYDANSPTYLAPCPAGRAQTGAPASSPPTAGAKPTPHETVSTTASPTCGATRSTSSQRGWLVSTARSWSRTCTWP
jgi:putative transposase